MSEPGNGYPRYEIPLKRTLEPGKGLKRTPFLRTLGTRGGLVRTVGITEDTLNLQSVSFVTKDESGVLGLDGIPDEKWAEIDPSNDEVQKILEKIALPEMNEGQFQTRTEFADGVIHKSTFIDAVKSIYPLNVGNLSAAETKVVDLLLECLKPEKVLTTQGVIPETTVPSETSWFTTRIPGVSLRMDTMNEGDRLFRGEIIYHNPAKPPYPDIKQ